jgi:hypothetical protein
MTWVKRFIVFLVVGFFLFYFVTQPEAAANAVRGVIGGLPWYFARSSSSFRLWLVSGGCAEGPNRRLVAEASVPRPVSLRAGAFDKTADLSCTRDDSFPGELVNPR